MWGSGRLGGGLEEGEKEGGESDKVDAWFGL